MCQYVSFDAVHNMSLNQSRLTEENLRLHSVAQSQTDQFVHAQVHKYSTVIASSQLTSEDDDSDAGIDHVALRKAASLEALQAYGGCFASGFLAMQNPLPWASATAIHTPYRRSNDFDTWDANLAMDCVETGSLTTSSSYSSASIGSPRPDSDTLSQTDCQSRSREGKWRWRSMRWKRSAAGKLQKRQNSS